MARFVVDQDVDARVVQRLSTAGHQAWTIAQAGLADASDEVVAVYARQHRAFLVTHDAGFARAQQKRDVGRTIWLACDESIAVDLLPAALRPGVVALDQLADDLGACTIWIRLRPDGLRVDIRPARTAAGSRSSR